MKKAERLLDLAAFLLRASEPVSWREIQEQFPEDYAAASEDASIRKFERDKSELLELGIPIRYIADDEDRAAGYVIDRDEFYLPDLKLPPEDLALLYLSGSAALAQGAFPYGRDLAHALNKLAFAARAPGASELAAVTARQLSEGPESARPQDGAAEKLEQLSGAVAHRKRVHIAYAGAERGSATERDVDPYGLYQQSGAWFLVGYCHLRKDLRTFHLERIRHLAPNTSAPRTPDFSPRKDFALAEFATRETWEYAVHEPMRCAIRVDASISGEARGGFGPRSAVREEDGAVLVEVTATNGEALVRHVLAFGDRAELISPKHLRKRAREILESIAEAEE